MLQVVQDADAIHGVEFVVFKVQARQVRILPVNALNPNKAYSLQLQSLQVPQVGKSAQILEIFLDKAPTELKVLQRSLIKVLQSSFAAGR